MWQLPLPDNSDVEGHIDVALTLVDGTQVFAITADQVSQLLDLYGAYDARQGRAEEAWKEAGLPLPLRNALHQAYDQIQKGKRLRELRAALLEAARRCPLCGISAVTDLDHHLPRSEFKALAIYCRNLVPACGPCNNSKRALSGIDGEAFIYAYAPNLPDERFLAADCEMKAGALVVTFRIVRTAHLAQEVFELLCYQMYHLELNRRLAAECTSTLGSHLVSIGDVYGADRDAARVADWSRRTAESSIRTFGLNDWRTALFFGLAECAPFCDGGFLTALGQASPY